MNANYKKCIQRSISIFETFKRANIASYIYEKMSESLISRWLYLIIPIFFYSINIRNMITQGVFYSGKSAFAYLNDLSNSLGFTLLYFISYFLSGYYPQKFEEWLKTGIEKRIFQ